MVTIGTQLIAIAAAIALFASTPALLSAPYSAEASNKWERKLTSTTTITSTTYTAVSAMSRTGILHTDGVDISTSNFKYQANTACTGNLLYAREKYVANSGNFYMTEINGVTAGQTQIGAVSGVSAPGTTVVHDWYFEARNACSGGTVTIYAGSMTSILEDF